MCSLLLFSFRLEAHERQPHQDSLYRCELEVGSDLSFVTTGRVDIGLGAEGVCHLSEIIGRLSMGIAMSFPSLKPSFELFSAIELPLPKHLSIGMAALLAFPIVPEREDSRSKVADLFIGPTVRLNEPYFLKKTPLRSLGVALLFGAEHVEVSDTSREDLRGIFSLLVSVGKRSH
jgi:hypothetical protein